MPIYVGATSNPFSSPQSAAWNPERAIVDGGQSVPGAQSPASTPGAHAAFVIVVLVLLVVAVAYHRGQLPGINARGSVRAEA